jgi:serine/threonine protein kinase
MRSPVLFGKYLLLERISVGGMAEVFKAKTFGVEGFEKVVAIKRILPSMAEDDDFIAMFIDEAKIAGQLSHANICQIYELGKIGNSHFIAMEYIQGKDVLQIQNRFRRLRRQMPLPMAALVASKVSEALDYAHRKKDENDRKLNIVHRDVSPQNVLVSYEGEIKIIDFGIAKAVSRSSKTQAGVLKGKFGYMSPEQVRGRPLDRRSDIFAIGTLLWEMCTDERLFTGPSDFAVLDKVRNATVPPPSAHNPMIPPELEAIIMRALRRDPLERYQWGLEMQEALQNYLLSQSPPWTTSTLSSALEDVFARELAREQVQLEHYRKITKEDLSRYAAPTPRPELGVSLIRRASQATAKAQGTPTRQPLQAKAVSLSSDERAETQVTGPSFLESAETVGVQETGSQKTDSGEFEGVATLIYDDGSVVKDDLPAEPTFVFNTELSQMVHAGERPILIESTGIYKDNGHAESEDAPSGPTVIFSVEGGAELVSRQGTLEQGPVTASLAPPSVGVAKDILIGVLSAALLILVGVTAYAFLRPWQDPGSAALVVSTTSAGELRVLLDGLDKGTVARGAPVTFRGLTAGSHRVVIVSPGGDPVAREVDIAAGDLKVLSISFGEGELGDAGGGDAMGGPADSGARAVADAGVRDARAPHSSDAGPDVAPHIAETGQAVGDEGDSARTRVARAKKTSRKRRSSKRREAARRRSRRHASSRRAGAHHSGSVPQTGKGYLVANTVPWAKVEVDGKDTGRTTPIPPASRIALKAGRHKITFDVNGKKFTFTVRIRPGKTTRVIKRLPVSTADQK